MFSPGLLIFPKCRSDTWVYISVVLLDVCPSSCWMYRRSVPFSNKWVANECRRQWKLNWVDMPAPSSALFHTFCTLLLEYLPPNCPSNNNALGRYDPIYCFSRSMTGPDSIVYLSFLPLAPRICTMRRSKSRSSSLRLSNSPIRIPEE